MSDPVQIGDAKLYLGDCLEILPTLDPVDAVVTDPPYGTNQDTRYKHRGRGLRTGLSTIAQTQAVDWAAVHGDDSPFDPAPFLCFEQVILWGANWYASRLPDSSKWLVWDKRRHTPPDHNADVELAFTNLKGPARMYRELWRGMLREGRDNMVHGPKVHPMQKALGLMEWCVEMTAGTVLDPFMGSGTTGVACTNLGRKFIGIEIEPHYFEVACRRIEAAQRQGKLFEPEQQDSLP